MLSYVQIKLKRYADVGRSIGNDVRKQQSGLSRLFCVPECLLNDLESASAAPLLFIYCAVGSCAFLYF